MKNVQTAAQQKQMYSAVIKAIKLAGGRISLAKICNTHPSHIGNWVNRDKKISVHAVLVIEKAFEGRITRHEMRPDIYPKQN